MDQSAILFYLLFIPHMLLALSIHEASHAGTAYYFGDDTAALQGRVSLNPLRHLDPMGVIAFFIIHFGWAKPVPVNPLRLRNPRRDEILVSLAGPGSNLVLGILLLLSMRLVWTWGGAETETAQIALALLFVGAQLNIGLCFFNLIPVPPLDGSHVLLGLLPRSVAARVEPLVGGGMVLLFVLVMASSFFNFPLFGWVVGKPMFAVIRLVLDDDTLIGVFQTLQRFRLI